MLVVAFGVLGLSYVATYGLVRRSLQNNALSALQKRATELRNIAQDTSVAALPRQRTNRLGMKLALVPAGSFWMGSPATEAQRSTDEGPRTSLAPGCRRSRAGPFKRVSSSRLTSPVAGVPRASDTGATESRH